MIYSETAWHQDRKSIQPLSDFPLMELTDIINTKKLSKSVARSNRISRNEVEVNVFDSWEAYDWEEEKVQNLKFSGSRHLITDQRIFSTDFQWKSKQE